MRKRRPEFLGFFYIWRTKSWEEIRRKRHENLYRSTYLMFLSKMIFPSLPCEQGKIVQSGIKAI